MNHGDSQHWVNCSPSCSRSSWEYTLLMHQTQFVPLPAGGSSDQFRLWEAFEAGDGGHKPGAACDAVHCSPDGAGISCIACKLLGLSMRCIGPITMMHFYA